MTIVPNAICEWVLLGASRPELIRDETLADIFEATARSYPDRPALALLGESAVLDYGELDRRSARVARALAAAGVRRGDKVGVWMRRSTELHVAILGILRAGAAYIPFDAEAPADRVGRCLADCGARILVTHAALGAGPSSLAVEVRDIAQLDAQSTLAGSEPERAGPDDPAYIIYTSGSTGEPKGILVAHRNVCAYVRSINETLAIGADDVVLQQASVAFDLSVEEIFVPYLVGAFIRVAPEAALREVDRLADALEADRVTVIDTVPTLLSMFDRWPASLRLVITGGEACPDAIVAKWTGEGCRLVNTYGPTETTVVATAIDLVPGDPVTIGRPIANYTAYVLDENLQPVPRGIQGELVIGGPGVAQGYVARPELTAQKFVANPHPELAVKEPVVYRTGDAVSIDSEGRLAFHGRIDAQVKVRGFRIELGEIEALIAREPGVKAATVSASKHAGSDILVAHVVADAGFDPQVVRKALSEKLPPYMVPTVWRTHSDLPRLASGKVDRKALAALPVADALAAAAGEQEAPSSVTEAHLVKAAREALALPAVPLDGDFFLDLGGNSLVAARFVSEVRKVPHLAGLAMQDVYAARSIRKLARLLDERARENAGAGNERTDLSFTPPPFMRRFLCGLAQLVALPFIIALVTAQWIGLLLASIYLVRDDSSLLTEIAVLCGIFVALNLGAKVLVVCLKWVVIGRTKPGVYPLWGSYYFRLWLMQRCVHLTAPKFLQGSPLRQGWTRRHHLRVRGWCHGSARHRAAGDDRQQVPLRQCRGDRQRGACGAYCRRRRRLRRQCLCAWSQCGRRRGRRARRHHGAGARDGRAARTEVGRGARQAGRPRPGRPAAAPDHRARAALPARRPLFRDLQPWADGRPVTDLPGLLPALLPRRRHVRRP
jgi:amino acid adenylation domain-containing protein